MPTNLPAKCTQLEREYREAKSLEGKIRALEAYIGSIPEHKGTMKLRSHLKTKLAKLREELENRRRSKAGASGRTAFDIKKTGAAQVLILGLTQVGKSQLLKALTNAAVEIGNRPYTTLAPVVGMMPYQDIQLSLVEAPAIMEGASEGKAWGPQVLGLARNSDGILLVLAADQDLGLQLQILLDELKAFGIHPRKGKQPRIDVQPTSSGGVRVFCANKFHGSLENVPRLAAEEDVRNAVIKILDEASEEDVKLALSQKTVQKPMLVAVNKADLASSEDTGNLPLSEGENLPLIQVSAKEGGGLEELKRRLFDFLGIMRVYPRRPGQPEPDKPLILRRGEKVSDAASRIHTDLRRRFRYAKLWGPSAKYPGEKVGLDFPLRDGDLIEIYLK